MTRHWTHRQSESARRFFFATVAVFLLGGILALLLAWLVPPSRDNTHLTIPPAFAVSSLFLLGGSLALQRAIFQVKREHQQSLRKALLVALSLGTLFVGVQCYGLWSLLLGPVRGQSVAGAGSFAFVMAVLHAMHFGIALLFLVFVSVRAFAGRYDHEYYWGVAFCAYFWHVLGIAWAVILFVFVFAAQS